jgi:hypothetical protein
VPVRAARAVATSAAINIPKMRVGTNDSDRSSKRLAPDAAFCADAGPKIRTSPADPLSDGYSRRFLNVIDETNGRMFVRWGMKGPNGTSSSGLN